MRETKLGFGLSASFPFKGLAGPSDLPDFQFVLGKKLLNLRAAGFITA
jgi:hypothetical protein